MNGNEVAEHLGVSRQFVSMCTRNGIYKIYKEVLRQGISNTPAEAVCAMMVGLGIHKATEIEVYEFINLFPKDIITKVKKELKEKKYVEI